MKRCIFFGLTIGLLAVGCKESPVEMELKMFQGEWVPVSGEVNGKEIPYGHGIDNGPVTFKGNTFKGADTGPEGTFTIDPTKAPKQINFKAKEGNLEIKELGIYEFDGDSLKLCFSSRERPKEFSAKAGASPGRMLIVFKKVNHDK
jgi:uncharacterized protein (TIGR03067 family)